MQKPEDILTDSDYLWSEEYLNNALPHYKHIVPFFKDKLIGKILDIGERNPLTKILEEYYSVRIDSTHEDLDCTLSLLNGSYNTIICSHVIEHLFNPLLFLWHVKGLMEDTANLYIITPIKPYWITPALCHFHEMDELRFRKLTERAGLTIIDWQKYSVPIEFKFGIRNILRRFYKEYSIVTLC